MEKSVRKDSYLEAIKKRGKFTPIQTKKSRDAYERSSYSEEKKDIEGSIQKYTKKNNTPEVQEAAEDDAMFLIEDGMEENSEKKKRYLEYLKKRMRTA
jgi:hypothetical protein